MDKLNRLPWPLIIGLGALALIRPVLSMTGVLDSMGSPVGAILVTVLISLAWLVVAVLTRVQAPLLTLTLTGVTYGVFAIVLSAVASPLLTGQLMGPLTNPIAIVSILITNAIWGGLVGLFAAGIQALRRSPSV